MLSRKVELADVHVDQQIPASRAASNFLDHIKVGLLKKSHTTCFIALAKSSKTQRFLVENDLLCTTESHLFVPNTSGIRCDLIEEC